MNCHDALSRIKAGKSGYNGEDADSNVVSIHILIAIRQILKLKKHLSS